MTAALVVAKAPVAGRVKTRLGAEIGMDRAAELAAAALLDTLEACATALSTRFLALDGELDRAVRGDEIRAALAGWTVISQRGNGLGARLRHAHEDVAALAGEPVLQIGMDTPQASAEMLRHVAVRLTAPSDAILGQACDGGWWLLGVGDPRLVRHLDDIPMSTPETGARTQQMLFDAGAEVFAAAELRDVDTRADAEVVAALAPTTRFAEAWR